MKIIVLNHFRIRICQGLTLGMRILEKTKQILSVTKSVFHGNPKSNNRKRGFKSTACIYRFSIKRILK